MKDRLLDIFKNIQLYQNKSDDLAKITSEKENIFTNSEYSKKINEFAKSFYEHGIFLTLPGELISDKTFAELLANAEKQVNSKLETPIQLDNYENDLVDAYNDLTEEEKQQFGTYENFKKINLEDWNRQLEEEKQVLQELIKNFKRLKDLYENINKRIHELDNERTKLLNDRWLLLETKLKNVDVKLLENGIEYYDGLPILKDDMELVRSIPKLDADNISLDDLVMVHSTRYFPQNGVIKTLRDSIGSNRNTIHTALNGKVMSHNFGNWDDCGIVILDPLKEHIDQVECIYSVDTFSYGSIKLSNESIILIDSSKYKELYAQNKEYLDQNKDRVLLFSGNSTVIVENLLSILGYAPEKSDQWSWENKYDSDMLNKFVQKNYPNKLNAAHDITPYRYVETGSVRDEALEEYGLVDDGNDLIITPEVLYALRMHNKDMTTEQFIINAGILVNDNEIHLLGIKDHIELLKSKKVSEFQIEKVELLIKKYELMSQKEEENTHQR